ncbi:hypothetical protein [Mycobacterium sp. 29Ha]|uniref:hypothetical protein n=1 Tax=Mycobacterium sp. 29Ha TaxID=2939268 RepID=UPI0029392E58|nr:hypothetical protein [Mycobacterium sp. 29Ha]MDV3136642.1 hypothetical protein [Mycobacterium sp. 29Ha]
MSDRSRPTRAPISSRESNGVGLPDNRLTMLDHAFYTGRRTTGHAQVIQVVWVYEHPIDLDGLKRFHHNLGNGLLARRIERSSIPFARHRWVSDEVSSDIDFAEYTRPRGEVGDWADERSQMPIDPEWGPAWHLGVLPVTDGSTAVSLVVSHYLIDGFGLAVAVADALLGNTRDLRLPPPRSRTRLRAAAQDARQAVQDIPTAARALIELAKLTRGHRHDLIAAAKTARSHRREIAHSPAPRPVALAKTACVDTVMVPGITIHVDLDEWSARAEASGGTSNTLVAGLAAKFGEHIGRRRPRDGAVTLQLPISDRVEGDTRANAMSFARVSVDPTRVTSDLHDIRASIKDALDTVHSTPDASSHLLWLTQFAPKRALKRLSDVMVVGDLDLPVFCSNLGDLGSMLSHLDGTKAEYGWARAVGQHVSRQWLEQTRGLMRLQCWRINGKVGITVVAYRPGAENTKAALRELAARTLADFELRGEID